MARAAPRANLADAFQCLYTHGFVRVAAASPVVALADPEANAARIAALAQRAHEASAALCVFPELALSGYSIDDLLQQDALHARVEHALLQLKTASADLMPALVVGAPLRAHGALYNCAVVLHRGRVLGVATKSYLPTYREYYERRQFAAAGDAGADAVSLLGESVPFGADLVFAARDVRDFSFHAEICEDMWAPVPPSSWAALAGATVLVNSSASNITIGKAAARDLLIEAHARRACAAYVYAAAGHGESTTDVAWDGQLVTFELGEKLAESARFSREASFLIADVDVGRLAQERRGANTFRDARAHGGERVSSVRTIAFTLNPPQRALPLQREIARFPFAPADPARLDQDCYEAYNIQVAGLVTRIEAIGAKKCVIGVSGGLDSTQALIVATRAMDLMGRPRTDVIGVTMPGFATSDETRANAWRLMRALKIDGREVSIVPLAAQMLADLNHPAAAGAPVHDVTYENVQAGLRTDYLFRLANQEGGLVVGTGDLSELALGWCTYGVGDHMSHYNVNAGAAKTLIQHLIGWATRAGLFDAATNDTLRAVLRSEISPELVPSGDGAPQSSEAAIGPYALQDFNLHYITRWGFAPSKVLFLAWSAWSDAARGAWPETTPDRARRAYSYEELRGWLKVFLARFFGTSQFKRSAVPNGPKLTSAGALSPRGDWRAPSDGTAALWLRELEGATPETLG